MGLALAVSSLAGCQNMVATTGTYYNAGLADSFNSLLLANIVRSAKGYPTYYSAIGDFSGSTSAQLGIDLNGDLPLNLLEGPLLSEVSLTAGLSPSISRDRNANVSSLETQDFAQSMHKRIATDLFLYLTESRDRAHLNLTLALLVEIVVIERKEYNQLIDSALANCRANYASLSGAHQGICRNFERALTAACPPDPDALGASPANLVRLHNDPTNPCQYDRFRAFIEAVVINEPHLEVDEDGTSVLALGAGASSNTLFGAKGTGFVLRSPHEVVHYLGQIVRAAYQGADAGLLRLSARDGQSVPVFVVRSGGSGGRSAVSTRVDGESYWIPRQRLNAAETHYSHRALAIIKDIIALNTSQSQLADNPTTILLGGRRIN